MSVAGEGGVLVSGRDRKRRESHVIGIGDLGTVLSSHPPFAEGLQDREGHRGASPGSCQAVQWTRAAL